MQFFIGFRLCLVMSNIYFIEKKQLCIDCELFKSFELHTNYI